MINISYFLQDLYKQIYIKKDKWMYGSISVHVYGQINEEWSNRGLYFHKTIQNNTKGHNDITN